MPQYGFFFDQSRCTGCHACTISCKSWNGLDPGPVKWMRVYQWEKGAFPNLRLGLLAIPCYHCEKPACMSACKAGAILKEPEFGAVLVDTERCRAAHADPAKADRRACWEACPYGAPQFPDDSPTAVMTMCTMCIDRLKQGISPICVLSCSLRALDFDTMDNLRAHYGNLQKLEEVPGPETTRPSVIFKPADAKKVLVPWDPQRALELWKGRGPFAPPDLPPVMRSPSDMTEVPPGIVGRDRLVLKPQTRQELMYYTANDE